MADKPSIAEIQEQFARVDEARSGPQKLSAAIALIDGLKKTGQGPDAFLAMNDMSHAGLFLSVAGKCLEDLRAAKTGAAMNNDYNWMCTAFSMAKIYPPAGLEKLGASLKEVKCLIGDKFLDQMENATRADDKSSFAYFAFDAVRQGVAYPEDILEKRGTTTQKIYAGIAAVYRDEMREAATGDAKAYAVRQIFEMLKKVSPNPDTAFREAGINKREICYDAGVAYLKEREQLAADYARDLKFSQAMKMFEMGEIDAAAFFSASAPKAEVPRPAPVPPSIFREPALTVCRHTLVGMGKGIAQGWDRGSMVAFDIGITKSAMLLAALEVFDVARSLPVSQSALLAIMAVPVPAFVGATGAGIVCGAVRGCIGAARGVKKGLDALKLPEGPV